MPRRMRRLDAVLLISPNTVTLALTTVNMKRSASPLSDVCIWDVDHSEA